MNASDPKRNKGQNARFHLLIGQNKIDKEDKEALVLLVSSGRVSSSAGLTESEMQEAIDRLANPINSSTRKMWAKCYEIYRDIAGLPAKEDYKLEQQDYDAINTFMRRCFSKPLLQIPYKTLPKAVTAMEMWKRWGIGQAVLAINQPL